MIVNSANLRTLYTSFSDIFQNTFTAVELSYQRVAVTVPSSTRTQEYGWLGQFPRIREWIGDRVVQNLATHGYAIRNRSFEGTIALLRDDIRDDNLGMYNPIVAEFARQAATFPDELTWPLLVAGFASLCFDGQYFFDTDHPRLDLNGQPVSFANTDGGAGAPWFLLDTTRVIRPIIFQTREPFVLTRMDADTDEAVFSRKEFRYGVDGRCNVGYGFPQLAWGSKQTLDVAHYETARATMLNMKGDFDRPLGIKPNLLVVGATNEGPARRLVAGQLVNGGETNPWAGTAEVFVSPWLN